MKDFVTSAATPLLASFRRASTVPPNMPLAFIMGCAILRLGSSVANMSGGLQGLSSMVYLPY